LNVPYVPGTLDMTCPLVVQTKSLPATFTVIEVSLLLQTYL
jgi:hypothetical protein